MKSRDGFVAVIVVFIVLALAVIGGIAYVHYVYLPRMAAQNEAPSSEIASTTVSTTNATSVVVTTTSVNTTLPSATKNVTNSQPTNVSIVSQPSAAVPTGWKQGKFSFTAPVTGCFAFNYPPTFSNPVGDSVSDNDGNTFDYSVDLTQNINFQEVYGIYKSQGFTEKDFTTTGGLAGKEFFLKNRDTLFDIFATGSQQIMIGLDFGHDPRVPSSSLALSTEEAIAQSVIFPCPSQ